MSKNCTRCNKEIESIRLEALPETDICITCAHIVKPARVKGIMHYAHKTAPTICIMSADHYENDWKKYNPKYGRGSGVHKMSPRPAGTA